MAFNHIKKSTHFSNTVKDSMLYVRDALRQGCFTSGMANRSIVESQLVDRPWFCIELTKYLKITFFNQYSFLLHFMTFSTCDFITHRSIVSYQEIF